MYSAVVVGDRPAEAATVRQHVTSSAAAAAKKPAPPTARRVARVRGSESAFGRLLFACVVCLSCARALPCSCASCFPVGKFNFIIRNVVVNVRQLQSDNNSVGVDCSRLFNCRPRPTGTRRVAVIAECRNRAGCALAFVPFA